MFACVQMLFICVKICCVLEESPIQPSVLLYNLTGTPFLPDGKDDKIPDWRR